MSKSEKTRAFIIEKTASVFNKKGYTGTSLNDITEVTGLTKGAVYGNFGNKDEVALAAFNYNVSQLNASLGAFIKQQQTPTAAIFAFTEFYRIHYKLIFKKGGCPIQNAAIEADDLVTFLRKDIRKSIENWLKMLSTLIKNGQALGTFKKVCIPENYASLFISLLEGGILLGKTMNNPVLLFNSLDRIDDIITKELLIGQPKLKN